MEGQGGFTHAQRPKGDPKKKEKIWGGAATWEWWTGPYTNKR